MREARGMAVSRRRSPGAPTRVALELGRRKVFASALDWPGWSRSGKDEMEALAHLADYGPRFAIVADDAGVPFPSGAAEAFDVVERLPGSATTDFGAPGQIAAADHDGLTPASAARTVQLLRAAWRTLDRVVAESPPALRKGPRGGGRDRDAVVGHVIGAETLYARKIGIRLSSPEPGDVGAIAASRDEIEAVLRAARGGEPHSPAGWPPRYAARRIAWHVLDHAWEIEDRRES